MTIDPSSADLRKDPAAAGSDTEPEQSLRRARLRFDLLAGQVPHLYYALDREGMIEEINPAIEGLGYDRRALIGRPFADLVHPDDRGKLMDSFDRMVQGEVDCRLARQYRIVTPSREVCWVEDCCAVWFDPRGNLLLLAGVCNDVSASVRKSGAMGDAERTLAGQMPIRAVELMLANEELQREIDQRRQIERDLRKREAELELDLATLQEANKALKVLFKRREADKHIYEDRVMHNVKQLLLPYLDKLKAVAEDERQKAYLSILETNLEEITSPFARRLSVEYFDLTPAEFKVANFIRQGKRTRDIAYLLGLSLRTVEAYRLSIRRKMRLQHKRVNLRTYLQNLR